jgi:hypothetical protein
MLIDATASPIPAGTPPATLASVLATPNRVNDRDGAIMRRR